MALQDLLNVRSQYFLFSLFDSFYETSDQAQIAPTVPATVFHLGTICLTSFSAEIDGAECGHISHELAVREVDSGLPFADEIGECYHRKGDCGTSGIFQVDYLWAKAGGEHGEECE
jgi:hypothetical protein